MHSTFKNLHSQSFPLLLGNVWNVQSAKVFEKLGFQAVGTSSAAIAFSLGYEDGEQMPFSELVFIVQKIVKNINIPLSVDLEFGYGETPEKVAKNIEFLANLGVAGINIEDSFIENSERKLKDKNNFYKFVFDLTQLLEQKGISIFINIRTDAFLLQIPNALEETLERIKLYEQANIDGFFVPCITQSTDIEQVANSTQKPINVMCMPNLPDFETLKNIGVKRISMGNFLNNFVYNSLENITKEITKNKSFNTLFQ